MALRRATRNLLALAALVALLCGAVYAEIDRERAMLPQALTQIDPARAQRLEIRCAAVCRSRRFERRADGWRMLEPYDQPASADAIAHLFAVTHAPIRVRLDMRDHDPARLGLAPPLVTLIVDDVQIAVGDEDPIEHDRYVRTGDVLARVPDRFSARLFEAPEGELADPASAQPAAAKPDANE
jgi:hypothetical protein